MGNFETITNNLDAAEQKRRQAAADRARSNEYRREQRRLSEPFIERTLAIAHDIQELVPYEEIVETPKIFWGARRAERRRAEKIANLRALPPQLVSGFGHLDGNPDHGVMFEYGYSDATVRHNNTPVYHFSPMYSSQVSVISTNGMFETGLHLNKEKADEITDYLDQIRERVVWQVADQVIQPDSDRILPDFFVDRVAPDQLGNPFFEEFGQRS